MNSLYKDGLSGRELRSIRSIKKQYKANKMGLVRKAIKIGVLGALMLSSYRCGRANAQELVQEFPSVLENLVTNYESTDQIRDLDSQPVYGFGLYEREAQCCLYKKE